MKDTKDINTVKASRQELILELIEKENISTQNELSKRLEEAGFVVTQATISRDIRELRLIKVSDSDGSYHYEVGKPKEKYQATHKFYSIFMASVVKIDYANNLVVIHCYTGMAQAVCATMDSL
jgi:transcriptional regulator of arginine metabolism